MKNIRIIVKAFALVLFLSFCTIVSAQVNQQREWNRGPLSWEEFKGEPWPGDSSVFCFAYDVKTRAETEWFGTTRCTYILFIPVVDMSQSWCRPDCRNEQTLQFLQTAFDMLEVECRRATNDYVRPGMNHFADNFIDAYLEEYEYKFEELDNGTQQGADTAMLKVWKDLIKHELDNIEPFTPHTDRLTDKSGIGSLDVGLFMHSPISHHVSTGAGITFGGQASVDGHVAMFNFAAGGCTANRDIKTHEGWIYKDEELMHYQFLFNYGYIVKQTPRFLLFPFAGMGATGYDLANLDDDEDVIPSKAGFSMDAGLDFEWTIVRKIDARNPGGALISSRQGLRLRPYVTLTRFHGEMGWVPSLNLSLSYFFGGLE